MIKISFPDILPRVKPGINGDQVFCICRKRWVNLTPEEWVRQNFLQFLIYKMKYPSSLIAVERKLVLGELIKRFDIVVFNRDSTPFMIVECKEMNVEINEKVMLQALRYNTGLQAPFLVLTNGSFSVVYSRSGNSFVEASEFPGY